MSLIYGSPRNLITRLNRHALTDMEFHTLRFSPILSTGEVDTKVRITALDVAEIRGSEVVHYQRLHLSKLPDLLPVRPRMPPADTLYELLSVMPRHLGIRFTEDDLEDALVVSDQGGYRVTLKAKETSYGWTGECELQFYELPPLSIPINETDIRW